MDKNRFVGLLNKLIRLFCLLVVLQLIVNLFFFSNSTLATCIISSLLFLIGIRIAIKYLFQESEL